MTIPSTEQRFRALYEDVYTDVLRFALRRVRPSQAAEDVVAEAMTTVWRRIDDLPTDAGEARAWVFGITRHCLLNHLRSSRRTDALGVTLALEHQGTTPDDTAEVDARLDLALAWSRMSEADQEVLALDVLDGLTGPQAAEVLQITPNAYRLRLSRARAALRRHLEGAARPAGAETKENQR